MKTILGLVFIAVLPVVATVILYLLNKHTTFGKLSNKTKQLIYGLIFGGLVFGAPAGVIAGLIGRVERYIAVYRGAGTYIRLSCTLSTMIAGVFSAVLHITKRLQATVTTGPSL